MAEELTPACFDTSTLVAALLQQHPHHAAAFSRLQSVHAGRIEGRLTTHVVAEVYATLTALPLSPRLGPADGRQLLQASILSRFELISLSAREYQEALEMVVSRNMPSGAIYDALHVVGARVSGCRVLYTLNTRHFQTLAPGDPMIAVP